MDITFWGKFCENGVLLVNFEQRVNEMLCHGTTRSKSHLFNSNICHEISIRLCPSNIITQTTTLSEILKKKKLYGWARIHANIYMMVFEDE